MWYAVGGRSEPFPLKAWRCAAAKYGEAACIGAAAGDDIVSGTVVGAAHKACNTRHECNTGADSGNATRQ